MNELELKELETKAEAGDTQAQIELAQHFDAEERGDDAIKWLQKAVENGDVHAKWLLAKRYFSKAPTDSEKGTALLLAASEGDAEAAHVVAVLFACGIGVQRDWSMAFDYLTRSAEMGFPLAREELYFLATGAPDRSREDEAAPENWKKLREAIDLSAWIDVPPLDVISHHPRIRIARGAASQAMCDWIIRRSLPYLVPAAVMDQATGEFQYSEVRTNSAASFHFLKMDMILAVMQLRVSILTGLSSGLEKVNILHYKVGEVYGPHFDFFAASNSDAGRRKPGEQRVLTFLLYLNDDYEGGETRFPKISWAHKGRKGDAMFFWNVDTEGRPDAKTLHEGTAPKSGEKWLLSQWIRQDLRSSRHPRN